VSGTCLTISPAGTSLEIGIRLMAFSDVSATMTIMSDHHPNAVDSPPRSRVTNEAIAERAYELWEQQGCQHGRHLENWRDAEHELDRFPTNVRTNSISRSIADTTGA
jgi:hypothetical protein